MPKRINPKFEQIKTALRKAHKERRFADQYQHSKEIAKITKNKSTHYLLDSTHNFGIFLAKKGKFKEKSEIEEFAARILIKKIKEKKDKLSRLESSEKKKLEKNIENEKLAAITWLTRSAKSAELAGNKKRNIRLLKEAEIIQ